MESALDLVRTIAADDPQLRSSFPLGLDLADPAGLRDDVTAVLAALQYWLGRVDPARSPTGCARRPGTRCVRRRWRRSPSRPPRPRSPTTPSCRYAVGCAAPSGTARTGRPRCSPGDARSRSPGRPATPLTELLAAGELKVADLPGLDAAGRLGLARRLVTESIVTVPEAGPLRQASGATARCGCVGTALE